MLVESQAFSLPMYPVRNSFCWMKMMTLQRLSLDANGIACAQILEDRVAFPGQSATAITLLEENGPFCDTYCIDMVTVWNILFEMFGQMPAWLHAALTKKEKNGRKLYRLLFAHYLGSDHVSNLANKMEAHLVSLTYCGKQKNWD
jgi:hypothetical protein